MGNKNRVEARLDEALLSLKKKEETMTEFIERAVKSLRDGNRMEHAILLKMIRAFVKQKVKASFTQDESEYIKKLANDEIKWEK